MPGSWGDQLPIQPLTLIARWDATRATRSSTTCEPRRQRDPVALRELREQIEVWGRAVARRDRAAPFLVLTSHRHVDRQPGHLTEAVLEPAGKDELDKP